MDGIFTGCYFPSGYNIYGNKNMKNNITGKFFIENRNILKNSIGIIAANIPKKPMIGLNICSLIMINKVSFDEDGKLKLTYSRLKSYPGDEKKI